MYEYRETDYVLRDGYPDDVNIPAYHNRTVL